MASRDLADLDPQLRVLADKFLTKCNSDLEFMLAHADVFITQTYRSPEEQDADYAQGRTAPGKIITNAKGGQSPHNCQAADGKPAARAFDFGVKKADGTLDWNPADTLWQTAIRIGQSLGLYSGSCFAHLKDNPHFELLNWRDMQVAQSNTSLTS